MYPEQSGRIPDWSRKAPDWAQQIPDWAPEIPDWVRKFRTGLRTGVRSGLQIPDSGLESGACGKFRTPDWRDFQGSGPDRDSDSGLRTGVRSLSPQRTPDWDPKTELRTGPGLRFRTPDWSPLSDPPISKFRTPDWSPEFGKSQNSGLESGPQLSPPPLIKINTFRYGE